MLHYVLSTHTVHQSTHRDDAPSAGYLAEYAKDYDWPGPMPFNAHHGDQARLPAELQYWRERAVRKANWMDDEEEVITALSYGYGSMDERQRWYDSLSAIGQDNIDGKYKARGDQDSPSIKGYVSRAQKAFSGEKHNLMLQALSLLPQGALESMYCTCCRAFLVDQRTLSRILYGSSHYRS